MARDAAADPSVPAIAHLLSLRPEVLGPPPPHDLDELVARIDDPYAVVAVMQSAPQPVIECAQALAGLGGTASLAAVAQLLGVDTAAVEPFADWLYDRYLTRPAGDEVSMSTGLLAVLGDPLGIGPPAADLLGELTAGSLRSILKRLGVVPPGRKAEMLAALLAVLRDPNEVRVLVDGAPARVRQWLGEYADPAADDDDLSYDPVAYRAAQAAAGWAADRGIVARPRWGGGFAMPREVTLALRGQDYHPPFHPEPPTLLRAPIDPAVLERTATSAATSFSADAVAVLDRLVGHPLTLLKSGGVGAREITKLAKVTGTDERAVRLVLELAHSLDLLARQESRLLAATPFTAWREAEPAQRLADLATAWWSMGHIPTEDRIDGKTRPALQHPQDCPACRASRHALVSVVAGGGAVSLVEAGPAALWHRPLVHADMVGGGSPFAGTMAEATTIGVIASLGRDAHAITPLGRALLDGDGDSLRAVAATVLPETAVAALFGADLTAVVPGAPAASLSRLLDSCADRESGGGAVTWRFSAGSVRRALDSGNTGDTLRDQLSTVARDGLPQPLEYLIGDVARRHGALRVRSATSVVRSDDAPLLAQACADRSLRALGLQLLAPTALTSEASAETTLEVLRANGYLPMPDGGVVVPEPARPNRAERSVEMRRRRRPDATETRRPEPVDLTALAEQLLSAPSALPAMGDVEQTVQDYAPGLSPAHARLLAAAVDTGEAVHITYRASNGSMSERVVSEIDLLGSGFFAYCHLRQDERNFALRGVVAVRPAPA